MRWTRVAPEPRSLPALGLLGLGTLLGLGAACSDRLAAPTERRPSPGASPTQGGTLRLAALADVRGLDPAGPVDGIASEAVQLLFAGLVELDERARVVPALAESWSVLDEGRTYRFTLRPGVQMHDGTELTAEDVVRSVARALDASAPNPDASYFADLEHVAPDGPLSVVFRLRAADATFLPRLAMLTLRPTCKSAGRRYSDAWAPCGAGPFKLEPGGWKRGTSLRLVRHGGYFRPGLPHLDAIEWTYNMQALTQRFRLEDGELDVTQYLTQADLARFLSDARWHPFGLPEGDMEIFGEAMNTRLPPFDRVEVRRAVAAAIDRDHYALLQPMLISPLGQALPPGLPGYDPSLPGQRHDYAAALGHMRRAGLPFDPTTGQGGWPEPVDYLLYDQGVVVYTAQLLQQDLAQIGIRLRLEQVSYSAFLALRTDAGRAGMSFGGWRMDYADPSALLDPLFRSPPPGSLETNSSSFYANPRLDDLLARARRTLDPEARAALYREANALVCDESPWAFTFVRHFHDVYQPYVHGLAAHPVLGRDVSGVWLDPEAGR